MSKKGKEKKSGKLGVGKTLAWQSASVSSSMNVIVLSYLSIYCTNALSLSPALVGTLLMGSKIFDGITDILAGYVVDRTNTRIGRGRPYQLSILAVWACTLLMFSCPAGWMTFAKCVWVFAMYTFVNSIFRTLFNASGTPYMVRAFNNNDIYVSLSTYGAIFPMIGAVIVNISFPVLMASLATSAKGWTTLIAIYAIPAGLLGLLRFLFIPEKYDVDAKTDKINLKEVFQCLKINKYIYPIAILSLVYYIISNMGVTTYYFQYVIGNLTLMSVFSMISMVMLPVMFLVPTLMKKFSLMQIMAIGCAACCLGSVINWFAGSNPYVYMIGTFFTGMGQVPIAMLTGLLVIDCADYNEWLGMPRMEATLSVIPGLASKLGSAFGAFILGIFLQIGGFVTSDSIDVVQPASAVLMLRLLISLVPFILWGIAAIATRFYKLDKMMPQIHADLDERRGFKNEE